MINIDKLKEAKVAILTNRNLAAKIIMESGAAGVELTEAGIEASIKQAEIGTSQETEPVIQESQASAGCSGCRGL